MCACLCSGVKGRVFDGSGVPVQNAVVEVKGRENMCPFRTDRHGEYYRLLLPGSYSFTVNAALTSGGGAEPAQQHVTLTSFLCDRQVTYPGHEVLTETLTIPYGPDQYSAMKHDFLLRQITTTTTRSPANVTVASTTLSCNESFEVESAGVGTRSTWVGVGVGLGLVAAALQSLID